MAKGKIGKHGKTRGRVAGSKNKKAPSWATQHEALSVRADIGSIERWTKKIGVERIDAAKQIRREVFATLELQDRSIDAGGRVVAQGAISPMEHQSLDPLRRAGILDDPSEPSRALWRAEAGVELLNLWMAGKVMGRCTAAWKAVGGGGGGGVSEADCDSATARAEMKYFRAIEAVAPEDRAMVHAVCLEMTVPPGTKKSRLCNALDLLSEHLFSTKPPRDVIRPKLIERDRTIPAWLKRGNG